MLFSNWILENKFIMHRRKFTRNIACKMSVILFLSQCDHLWANMLFHLYYSDAIFQWNHVPSLPYFREIVLIPFNGKISGSRPSLSDDWVPHTVTEVIGSAWQAELLLECHHHTQGLYSLSRRTSYPKISWSLEAARLDVIMMVSLWNLTGTSAAALPRCLPIFREIGKV